MLRNLVSNIYVGIKDFLGPSVIDGRLNPRPSRPHPPDATGFSRGYSASPSFGFFSSGPPPSPG